MSDDSFIREVNEDLRQDRMQRLWRRYGALLIAAVVLIVLATAGYVGYDYWVTSRANRSGDAFSRALELANQGDTEDALAALSELQRGGHGAYPLLARLREATVLADSGDLDGAVAAFDAVADEASAPDAIRDMARLRAALILVDHGSYEDVASRVEPLTSDDDALRHTAREALGLAAWNEGRLEEAAGLFEQIADDPNAPGSSRQRAELMSELIAGSGVSS